MSLAKCVLHCDECLTVSLCKRKSGFYTNNMDIYKMVRPKNDTLTFFLIKIFKYYSFKNRTHK